MKLNNERGIALVIAMFVMVVLMGLSGTFVLRSVGESRTSEIELQEAKAFYIAEGGSNAGLDGIDTLINTFLNNEINSTNPSVVAADAVNYVNTNDGIGFLMEYVIDTGGAQALTLNGTQAEYNLTGNLGSGNYDYDVIITEKGNPIAISADIWDFSYNYRIEADGTLGNNTKEVLISGDFTVQVQRDNFAKYALFTNEQKTDNGYNVWFTSNTNFAGPLHTNDRYNIYGNPSGIFEQLVEQHQQTTRYYNGGWPYALIDDDHNGTSDVPTFNGGFTRDVPTITLSSPVQQQDMIDQATAGNTYGSNGIYIPNDGTDLTGGIFMKGNGNVVMQFDGSGNPQYKITQGSTTKYVTLDKTNNQTSVQIGAGSPTVYGGLPDGVDDLGTIIFVDGRINTFKGTVHATEEITVASNNDIIIKDHVQYSSYTAATGNPGDPGYVPPSADGSTNLLGIVSWGGDVRIGTAAPDNVNVHGTVLAKEGVLEVDDYNVGSPRGIATILGGVISDNYGGFGTFSGSTGTYLSGYGRNFVYDQRMQSGSSPPYFPTLNTYVAFTNDITDKMVWQEGDS